MVPCWIRLFPAAWMYGTLLYQENPGFIHGVISIIIPETLPMMVSSWKTGEQEYGIEGKD